MISLTICSQRESHGLWQFLPVYATWIPWPLEVCTQFWSLWRLSICTPWWCLWPRCTSTWGFWLLAILIYFEICKKLTCATKYSLWYSRQLAKTMDQCYTYLCTKWIITTWPFEIYLQSQEFWHKQTWNTFKRCLDDEFEHESRKNYSDNFWKYEHN